MPYSVGDSNLPSNVKKLPAKKKAAWVATFNSVYDKCTSGGGDKKTCETKAFKVANAGAEPKKAQPSSQEIATRTVFRKIFDGFLDSIGMAEEEDRFNLIAPEKVSVERAMSIERIYQQIYDNLRDQPEWSYPMQVYLGDGESFCTVAQSGMIYKVPLSVANDTVTMGDWQRVEETFSPVVEQSFRVRRDKNGKYRWTSIAGTTVLNRDGELDSSELFDSFVAHAEKTGEYPRLDFYHLGLENPKAWEFGTADFLAREGVCYIASGTFDEDHPLAQATIKACKRGDQKWGNSVEFYASTESELIAVDPMVEVKMYKQGRNSRISLLLEEDAAGLFTQYGISQEIQRSMDAKTREKLKLLYGGDEAGLQKFLDGFEAEVDGVNRTVKDKNLIHRGKKQEAEDALDDADDADEEDTDETEEDAQEDDARQIEIDDETVAEIAGQVAQSKTFTDMATGIAELKKMIGGLIVERDNDKKEITRLSKAVEGLNKEESEKKEEYLQDLPRNKRTHITHRPRDMRDADGGNNDTMADVATRTLNGIPAASHY